MDAQAKQQKAALKIRQAAETSLSVRHSIVDAYGSYLQNAKFNDDYARQRYKIILGEAKLLVTELEGVVKELS